MSVTLSSLGLDRLPRAVRLELVQALWDSIAAESGPSLLSDAQHKELERRADEDDADPSDVVAWEDVEARIQARLRS
jgi:putative addiction module component (TIGR02574 family)